MKAGDPIQLGRQVLALVKRADPKAEALVTAVVNTRRHTRFARNEITTAGENADFGVTLTVQLGLRSANASTNQVDAGSLDALVRRTLDAAKLAPELPETMPVLGKVKVTPATLSDPALVDLDAKTRAQGMLAALEPSRAKDLVTAGYLEVNAGTLARLSSAGLEVAAPFTGADFSVTARTKDGTGSGWNAVSTRTRKELDFARVGRIAAEKALASQKPTTIEPGRYTVVLESAAATELVSAFVTSLDRRAVDEGRSCFVGKLGTRVINERLTFVSDPKTCAMVPFDGEGVPLAARTWVDKGVVKELGTSRYWAKKQNVAATGAYDGVEVRGETVPTAKLFEGIKRGVLITRLWYVNSIDAQTLGITGLTRDGTFLIEDGVVTRPIKNFRINQSVLTALDRVDAVADVLETPGSPSWRIPAMRTHEFLLASSSDAV